MRAFVEPLQELSEYGQMVKTADGSTGLISITGCIDSQKPHMMYAFGNGQKNKLIVTFNEQKAKELYEEYRFFDPDTVYYPAKDVLFYQSDIRGNVLTAERINAIKAIREQERVTLVTTFDALMNTMPPVEKTWSGIIRIAPGDIIDIDEFKKKLVELGYEKDYQVETRGQFAIRGGIIDIFPLTEENPARIELWDDEIDTIRSFDTESQKSIENLDELVIYPACELVLTEEEKAAGIKKITEEAEKLSDKLRKEMKTEEAYRIKSTAYELAEEWGVLQITAGMDAFLSYFCKEKVGLLDYFPPDNTYVFFDEISRCAERGKQTETEFSESMKQRLAMGYILPGQMKELFLEKEVMGKLAKYSCVSLSALDTKSAGLHQTGQYGIHVQSVSSYNNSFELLIKDLKKYKKKLIIQ